MRRTSKSNKHKAREGLKGGHAQVAPHRSTSSTPFGCADSAIEEPRTGPKGLKNIGNSCYANATLQCLLNTALPHALTDPRASAIFRRYSSNPNILAQGSGSVDSEEDCCTTATEISSISGNTTHRQRRKQIKERKRREHEQMLENCNWLTTELRSITQNYWKPEVRRPSRWTFSQEAIVIDPGTITRQPQRLSKSLVPYSQEDAHEFMRALLTNLTMQGQNKELSSLFDGLLESSVTCQSCFRPSLTRDRYMDLSLDIAEPHIHTLTDALEDFTKSETLSGDNAVYCRHCKHKRTATKGLRLATAPSILVCHLKRFAFDKYGRLVRLKKQVQFPRTLEIGDFMSKVNQARPPPYELVAVLVHQGNSCEHGHYLAYVKNAGLWYRCNDSIVEEVDFSTVLSQQAYICMYEVADMRVNHGYAVKNQPPKPLPTEDSCFGLPGLFLCGADYGPLLSDFCQWSKVPPPSKPRRKAKKTKDSRDDLSTLGESTVESSQSSRRRFKRSISSGHLRHPEYDNSHHRRSNSSTVKLKERQAARQNHPTRRRNTSNELPPRPYR